MTQVLRGLGVMLTALALWFSSLVMLGLLARITYLGLLTGWSLI